jgi:beta-N-acetylhexosaminidase
MTFHGFLPALDSSGVPATLSPKVMTDLLRRELGFEGLLVTDAMDMAGVVARYGVYEASKRALAAGADVLLMPPDIHGTIDSVVAGVREGRYTEARINASVRRLLRLKTRFSLHRNRLVVIDSVRAIVGDSTHAAIARTVAERGIVLAKDSLELVPLPRSPRPTRVLSISYARRADLGAGTSFNAELRRVGLVVAAPYVNADDDSPNLTTVLAAADSADVVVIGAYVNISSTTATAAAPPAFTELMAGVRSRTARVVLVAFGSPYVLQAAPAVSSYLVAWGGHAASQRAAARALAGEIGVTATLPVSVPPLLPFGAGEQRAARGGGS